MQYEIFTNIGKRQVNEDSLCVSEHEGSYCFTLADGLGGHGKGEVASQLVVQSICGKFQQEGYGESFLEDAFGEAQEALASEKKKRRETTGMMTTGVSLILHQDTARWAHIGDSRLYYFYRNKVVARTIDHSVPQMLVLSKELKEKNIRNHPDRNKLTKAFGSLKRIIPCTESEPVQLEQCQGFLLCSDGFWELIYEKEMCRLLKKTKDASAWMNGMVEKIVARGADRDMDNFTAIAVRLDC